MRIREILAHKGRDVFTIEPDGTVADAVQSLVERNIGSLVVAAETEVRGILTERDILQLAARRPATFQEIRVADVMTTDVVTGEPDDEIGHVMNVMTRNRIRHLPVVGSGGLEGLVSIGDVVNALRENVQDENRHLKAYIRGSTY